MHRRIVALIAESMWMLFCNGRGIIAWQSEGVGIGHEPSELGAKTQASVEAARDIRPQLDAKLILM